MPSPKKSSNPPKPPKKEIITYEFRIYTLASGYTGDLELLAAVIRKFKDVHTDHGRSLNHATDNAGECARNIGLLGITIETPEGIFNYYPPSRIAKVEYNEIKD